MIQHKKWMDLQSISYLNLNSTIMSVFLNILKSISERIFPWWKYKKKKDLKIGSIVLTNLGHKKMNRGKCLQKKACQPCSNKKERIIFIVLRARKRTETYLKK